MIGVMTAFDIVSCTTETLVTEDNIFVSGGFLSPAGMMENMAQTCAARTGFYNKYILHKPVRVGVIGAVRDFRIYGRPAAGSVITTRVIVEEEVFGMTLAQARIAGPEGETLSEAKLKLSVRNDD